MNTETYVICKKNNPSKAYDINTLKFELATPSVIWTRGQAEQVMLEDIGDDPSVIIMERSKWEALPRRVG